MTQRLGVLAGVTVVMTLAAPVALAAEPPPPATPTVVIRAGRLIDTAAGKARDDQWIVISGDRVSAVHAGAFQPPAGAELIDLSGWTVLPGLIDTHTHLTDDPTLPPYHGYGIVHRHEDAPKQLAYMIRYGMTPMQALQAATVNGADALGLVGQIGTIAPGAYADIITVQGDPLADVSVLEKVGFVMKGGKVYKRP